MKHKSKQFDLKILILNLLIFIVPLSISKSANAGCIDSLRALLEKSLPFGSETYAASKKRWEDLDKLFACIKLTEKQKYALSQYQGSMHEKINQFLRGKDFDAETEQQLKEIVKDLDSIFEVAPALPKDTVVFRGVNLNGFNEKAGDSINESGYLSTSTSQPKAMSFTNGDNKEVLFEISVPKGTKFITLNYDGELELLFPKGAKILITTVKEKAEVFWFPAVNDTSRTDKTTVDYYVFGTLKK